MQKVIVGTNQLSYLEQRNFAGLDYNGQIAHKKIHDLYKIYNFILFKTTNKINPNYQFSFRDFGLNNVDIYHFFSSIYYGKKPWIVTSSTPLPRWTKNHKKGLDRLVHPSCKKIILLSKNCYDKQQELLSNYPEYSRAINEKTTIISPSQDLLVSNYQEKVLNTKNLVFTVVGHQILIKGGLEIVRCFNRLHSEGISSIQLNIVSALHPSNYLDYDDSRKDINFIKKSINDNPLINHFPSLPNHEVIKLLKSTHVALLPSYGDTFGYSVLESQACGCPVISTNISALEEINNDSIGWIIPVPLKEGKRANIVDKTSRMAFSEILENGLYKTIKSIIDTPHIIEDKGTLSLKNIQENHSPSDRSILLKNIYLSALK